MHSNKWIISKYLNSFKIFSDQRTKSSQPAITCSMLKKETLDQGVKYVQS